MILRGLRRQYCQHQHQPVRLQLSLAILKPDLVQHSPHHRQVQQMILDQEFLVVRSKSLSLSRARQESMSVFVLERTEIFYLRKQLKY